MILTKDEIEKYEERLHDVLYSKTHVGAEIGGELQIALGYAKAYNKKIILYGSMKDIDCYVHFFLAHDMVIECIVDRLNESVGKSILGIPVVNENQGINRDINNCVCFSLWYEKNYVNTFLNKIEEKGIKVFCFESIYRAIISVKSVTNDVDRIQYYIENETSLRALLSYCIDIESCEVLIEYIRSYIEVDVYRLPEIPTCYKYFGDAKYSVYQMRDDEKWINFGASTGDTLWSYFLNNLSAEKIYAIEADTERYTKLKENISLLPPEFANKCVPYNIFIEGGSDVEKLVGNEIITLINADIEGYELDMLKAFSQVIKRDKPVLALCMYHKKEDFVEIPKFIIQMSDEYRFAIRKYTYCYGDMLRNMEIVLYAIPKDRQVDSTK